MSGKPESQVVSGGGSASGFRSPSFLSRMSRRAGLIAAGVVVVVAALLGYLYYQGHDHSDAPQTAKKADTGTTAKLQPVAVDYVQLDDAQLTSKVNYLVGTKQLAEAEKLITIQNDLQSNKVKLSLLANIQQLEGKKAEAAETSQKIAALGELAPGQYEQIARQYEAAGDKADAIAYYQKAADAYNARKQGSYQRDVARVQAKIEELR